MGHLHHQLGPADNTSYQITDPISADYQHSCEIMQASAVGKSSGQAKVDDLAMQSNLPLYLPPSP